jgi:two-component system LytT family response regulator
MTKPYRALIIDDERLARKDLAAMLADVEGISVVGEAEDAASASLAMERLNPDVIFLDVQMPGESGFDLLEKHPFSGKVVFVTAYDEYAIRAFEVNALDYLLKPVNPERLARSIERLEMEEEAESAPSRKLLGDDRLFLSVDDRLRFVKVGRILCIQSAGDYSEVWTADGEKTLTSKPLREWEHRLPVNCFCRIHRCTIVNMDYIERIEEWFNHSYRLTLKGVQEPFVISRRYAAMIRHRFG